MTTTAKFTLRFHDAKNHEILGVLAERLGVSKNQLAEEMLGRELQAAALLLEKDLTGTLELLRAYRPEEHLEQAIAEVAHAEAYGVDPLETRMVEAPQTQDGFGIAEAFS
jgi:hypothetical protein